VYNIPLSYVPSFAYEAVCGLFCCRKRNGKELDEQDATVSSAEKVAKASLAEPQNAPSAQPICPKVTLCPVPPKLTVTDYPDKIQPKLILKDFQPLNIWEVDTNGKQWPKGGAKFLVDTSTGRKYLKEDTSLIRKKCAALVLGTLVIQSVTAILNIATRVFAIVKLLCFWQGELTFKARLLETRDHFLKIIATPFALIGMLFASMYGVIRPYDGRKLYASMERLAYDRAVLAPCFQPNPTHHLLGGKIDGQNVW